MATALRRPVAYDERLSLTEHLDELRSRLIVCVLSVLVAFGITFWQNETVLRIVNAPLQETQRLDGSRPNTKDPLEQAARYQILSGRAFRAEARAHARSAAAYELLAERARDATERRTFVQLAREERAAQRAAEEAAAAVPDARERRPVTLGVAEPFTTTVTISFYAALLLALPMILYQVYAFVLPAFAPGERRIALPLMLMVPALFVAGVAFAYFVVLPRAIGFLQNFNDDDFDILIQARDYYKFAVLFIGAVGLMFQIPLAVLAVTRLGILTPRQLQRNWGYVVLGLAVLAAVATPTPDPITMLLAMLPLFLLFELSILVSAWLNRVSPPGTWWGEGDADDSRAPAFDDED
jgi:sec-independent protein translocase protein TatC